MGCVVKTFAGVVIIAMGMAGPHFDVEYSGWVLFVGCLVALS